MPRPTIDRALGERLMTIRDVQRETTLSRTSIYRKVADRSFPPPVKIGASRIAWKSSDIVAWLADLPPAA